MIHIRQITNPVDPSRDPIVSEVEYTGGKLKSYLKHLKGDATVAVNGHVWPRSLWSEVTPRNDDFIIIAPHTGNSPLLKTLGSITIMVAAAATAFFLGPAGIGLFMFGMSSAMSASVLAGAVSIAGGLIMTGISALLTPSQPTDSASYDPDGPTSIAKSGTVIPKGYGKFSWGGNCISSFTDLEGANQYINALFCYGFGPVRELSIADILINGKPAADYRDIQIHLRNGTNDQTAIPNFNRIVNGYAQNTKCLAGVPVVIPGTGTLTQILQVDVSFPDGVFCITNDGNKIPEVVTYLVEVSEAGSGVWQTRLFPRSTANVVTFDVMGNALIPEAWGVMATDQAPGLGIVYATDNGPHNPGDPWSGSLTVDVLGADGSGYATTRTFYGEWQKIDATVNQVLVTEWGDGVQNFCAASQSALYARTTIYLPHAGKWNTRITKYGSERFGAGGAITVGDNNSPNVGQDIWVHSVNEIEMVDLVYPNMILIGIRALATSQLSGQNLSVTAEITHGCRTIDNGIMPTALLAYEEDNPAVVAADMMLDQLYGGGATPGVKLANIERFIDEWVAWAEMNDELVDDGNGGSIRRHVFRGVFDNESNLWAQVNSVGQMSRACLMPFGRDYGVYIDQEVDAPVQMFSVRNIIADSFTETFLNINDRANQIEIDFADSTRNYKTDNPIAYMDPELQDAGVAIKNSRITARGVVVPAQAWHLAEFKAKSTALTLRSGSFRTNVDGIACRPGNVVLLQHDVPKWGWGGGLLPGSSTTNLKADRTDLPFVTGTAYSLVVLHSKVQRFSGNVGTLTAPTEPVGFILPLAGWDNDTRVTRAIVNGIDYLVLNSSAGSITVSPPPGVTPLTGQTCVLYDTDVMETQPVASVKGTRITLAAPLSQKPDPYANYIYGPAGAAKWVKVIEIKKAAENRATIGWAEYNPLCYVSGTPTIGETSAVVATNPMVTSLTGSEIFTKNGGNWTSNAHLAWKNGPDTVGVGIYTYFVDGAGNPAGPPLMIDRLTSSPTSWNVQISPGTNQVFIVVGFDKDNVYASFKKSPSVTINAVGVANNLLLDSSFTSGFAYWNITPRVPDTFTPTFQDDGEAVYTIVGSALATARQLLYQPIQPAKWAVGDYLMLSGYFQDSCIASGSPNAGTAILTLTFQDGTGALTNHATTIALNGVTPSLTRISSAAIQIPTGTVMVTVEISVGGTGFNMPVGSMLTCSHFLLEVCPSAQTIPSAWADIDVNGKILDIFTNGSSTALRVQGSIAPTFTGSFTYTSTPTTLTIAWTGLAILWPDGAYSYIQDGSITLTGLTNTTTYFASLYFDVVYGGIHIATPSAPLGADGLLSAAFNVIADAICKQDGHVPLTPTGLSMVTAAPGSTGGGGGGDVDPLPGCTVPGTNLQTPDGPVSNSLLKALFDAGEQVYLLGRTGPELVRAMDWLPVSHVYRLSVEGQTSFCASSTHTLRPEGGDHTWCAHVADGTRVETTEGYAKLTKQFVQGNTRVLRIELEGPSHEYLIGSGVWSHNYKLPPGHR